MTSDLSCPKWFKVRVQMDGVEPNQTQLRIVQTLILNTPDPGNEGLEAWTDQGCSVLIVQIYHPGQFRSRTPESNL